MLAGHFINSPQGRLFITQMGQVAGDSAILCLPSITEEMNLARAVVAKQAQSFASTGLPCFILDYYGTGDSEGEFQQANSDIWLDNIFAASEFIQQQGVSKIILWGVRFGALLMLNHQEILHQQLPISQQLLWKPITSGKLFIAQFLRIKQANALFGDASDSVVNDKINWREYILAGNNVEVSGYLLTKTMLQSIELLKVSDDFQPLSTLHWFELAAKAPTPLTNKLIGKCNADIVSLHCVECPPFWQVPEVFSLPELTQLMAKSLCIK